MLCWSAIARHWSQLPASAAQIAQQLRALMVNPLLFPRSLVGAVVVQWHEGLPWGHQFIGVLGWLDTPLPPPYLLLAGLALLAALVMSCPEQTPLLDRRARIAVVGSVAAAILAILFFQYLSWTPVGAHFIDGVQGRYFLPIALLLPLALPQLVVVLERLRTMGGLLLCLFPSLSIPVTLHAIVWRYYLS